jgi:hypothetical protein
MQIGGIPQLTLRYSVWIGAVAIAPLLLLCGPLYDRYLTYVLRDGGPGLLNKAESWVHPAYWILTNRLVRALTWPSRRGGLLRRWLGRVD